MIKQNLKIPQFKEWKKNCTYITTRPQEQGRIKTFMCGWWVHSSASRFPRPEAIMPQCSGHRWSLRTADGVLWNALPYLAIQKVLVPLTPLIFNIIQTIQTSCICLATWPPVHSVLTWQIYIHPTDTSNQLTMDLFSSFYPPLRQFIKSIGSAQKHSPHLSFILPVNSSHVLFCYISMASKRSLQGTAQLHHV
jgi:hypothetical protein